MWLHVISIFTFIQPLKLCEVQKTDVMKQAYIWFMVTYSWKNLQIYDRGCYCPSRGLLHSHGCRLRHQVSLQGQCHPRDRWRLQMSWRHRAPPHQDNRQFFKVCVMIVTKTTVLSLFNIYLIMLLAMRQNCPTCSYLVTAVHRLAVSYSAYQQDLDT